MTEPGIIFKEIHKYSKHAFELQENIGRIPRQIKAQKTRIERMEKEFKDFQDHLKKLKVSIHEKEVSFKELNTKFAKLQKQQNEASDNKAYDALKIEIGTTKAEISKVEDEILLAITEQEEKTAALPEQEKLLKAAKAEAASIEKNSTDRKAELEVQLNETNALLKAAESQLSAEHLPKYLRIVQSFKHEALSPLEGKTCSSCATEITSQMMNEVRSYLFVACKSCNRLLYLSEQEERVFKESEAADEA
jgi:predicted  nucleic acid-binding Zn-ribbon protein